MPAASNQNIAAMTKAMREPDIRRDIIEFADWIKAGRAVVTDRSVNGNLNVLPVALSHPDRWTQTQALEGVNPFRQDLPEFYWQAYKAGMLTFEQARQRSFTE